MKIICRQNCSGKTKELIKESLDKDIPILALTPMKENSLKEKSQAYFGEELKVINFLEAQTYDGDILIDDVDEILSQLVRLAFKNDSLNVKGIVINN